MTIASTTERALAPHGRWRAGARTRARLLRPDRPRAIDQYIDYFGERGPAGPRHWHPHHPAGAPDGPPMGVPAGRGPRPRTGRGCLESGG